MRTASAPEPILPSPPASGSTPIFLECCSRPLVRLMMGWGWTSAQSPWPCGPLHSPPPIPAPTLAAHRDCGAGTPPPPARAACRAAAASRSSCSWISSSIDLALGATLGAPRSQPPLEAAELYALGVATGARAATAFFFRSASAAASRASSSWIISTIGWRLQKFR